MEVPDQGIYADKEWPEEKKSGAAMICRLDGYIGTIVEKLNELGLADETLIIFSSDNGPHREGGWDPGFFDSNGELRGIKRDLYEGGIRVPFIAYWPGTIKHGVSDHVSAFWDFMPTACELAGIELPESSDGISYLPVLLNNIEKQEEHEYLYWEFYTNISRQAVRKGEWKAVKLGTGNPPVYHTELYNLSEDIAETNDLAAEHPELVKELEAIMDLYPRAN